MCAIIIANRTESHTTKYVYQHCNLQVYIQCIGYVYQTVVLRAACVVVEMISYEYQNRQGNITKSK